jgi:hypothetical protein
MSMGGSYGIAFFCLGVGQAIDSRAEIYQANFTLENQAIALNSRVLWGGF